jgi:ribosome-associated protein
MIVEDEFEEPTEGDGWDGPSRSQRRRDALAVLDIAQRLMEAGDAQLARLPLDEDLLALVRESRRVTQQIARKRQTQFLAKNLRRADEETLQAIRAAFDHAKADSRRDTAALHRIETWRERLITDGDAALGELLVVHPGADRQHLRQLARNAQAERLHNKPPHAQRELFRTLRDLLQETGSEEA